jgi:hypothetical protein
MLLGASLTVGLAPRKFAIHFYPTTFWKLLLTFGLSRNSLAACYFDFGDRWV